MKKILILSAGFGEGHNTAARSVQAALEQVAPQNVEARVLDVFATTYGRANEFSRQAYLAVINHAPLVWAQIYNLLDKTMLLERSMPAMRKMQNALAELLARERPDTIVSTYPVYNFLVDRIYHGPRPFKQLTIVTDSITVNSVWHRVPSDRFFVPNEDTAEVMRRARVPAEKILVTGFPVTPRFAANEGRRTAPAPGNHRVLFMINFAKAEAPALVRELLKLDQIDLTVTVGRDEELRAKIENVARERGRSVEIFGWTSEMPNLVMRSHLLISKAGGATVQEAIAARTPMIISQVVPGQEEGNAQLIVQRGCGVVAETHAKIAAAVERAFANDAKIWHEWHHHISALSRPAAALEIARLILSGEQAAADGAARS